MVEALAKSGCPRLAVLNLERLNGLVEKIWHSFLQQLLEDVYDLSHNKAVKISAARLLLQLCPSLRGAARSMGIIAEPHARRTFSNMERHICEGRYPFLGRPFFVPTLSTKHHALISLWNRPYFPSPSQPCILQSIRLFDTITVALG